MDQQTVMEKAKGKGGWVGPHGSPPKTQAGAGTAETGQRHTKVAGSGTDALSSRLSSQSNEQSSVILFLEINLNTEEIMISLLFPQQIYIR